MNFLISFKDTQNILKVMLMMNMKSIISADADHE